MNNLKGSHYQVRKPAKFKHIIKWRIGKKVTSKVMATEMEVV